MRERTLVAVVLAGVGLGAGGLAALACSAVSADALATNGDGGRGDASSPGFDSGGAPFADAGTPELQANAIVLVHAASFPAFRICFNATLKELPLPSVDLLPDSNVVGVDVGTAVRLAPPRNVTALGRASLFPESALRPLYPPFGGAGPTCEQLLSSAATKSYAIDVGEVTADVSRGVHALVLGGCRPAAADPVASTDRCGADWTAAAGNLKLTTLPLTAYVRPGDARLLVQLVQLSPGLERRARGRALGLAFGAIDAGAAPPPFVEGAVPFGQPVPNPPAMLEYTATDIGAYATSGVFVTLGGAVDDAGAPVDAGGAGPREVLVMQSLAEIQKRSSPRSLPPDWFGIASSYVVLSVGDPDPRVSDGGVDDDPRRALHLLAIPLAAPDGGAQDGGT